MGTILSQQSVGEALLATGTAGTTDYTFLQLRQLTQAFAGGVLDLTAFKVTQRGAGANLSVDVADGAAWIPGTTDATYDGQQRYGVRGVSAVVNLGSITAPAVSPRRDIVVARAYDSAEDAGAGTALGVLSDVRLQYIKNASETLVAEATPANAILLAYVDMTVGLGSVTNAIITDMRPLAGCDLPAIAGGMYCSANQAIGASPALVLYQAASTQMDSNPGMVSTSNNRLIIPKAGLYQVSAEARCGGYVFVVAKNAAGTITGTTDTKIISSQWLSTYPISFPVKLAANDYLQVFSVSGGAGTVSGGLAGSSEQSYLRAVRLGV